MLRGNAAQPLLFSSIVVFLTVLFVIQHALIGWSPLLISSYTAEALFGSRSLRKVGSGEDAASAAISQTGSAAAFSAAIERSPEPMIPATSAPVVDARPNTVIISATSGNGGGVVIRPSASELAAASKDLRLMCTEEDAWVADFWFSNRTTSVDRQHRVRNALNTIAQAAVSDASVRTPEAARPCKRTVVSLSTIPSRINRLEGLMQAIKAQSYAPDAILIGIPPFAPRMKKAYVVPDYLAKDPAVKIVPLPVDFGPLSKLAAALYAETDPDTCIITVDDDNLPRPHLFQLSATWASAFPSAVIGESGWNVTCILSKIPYVCGEGYDVYVFVRQDWDVMCHPDSLPRYNFHQCLGPVDSRMVRPADVVMGVSNPLYRRGFFGPDFLDVAKVVARRKVRQLLVRDDWARKLQKEGNLPPASEKDKDPAPPVTAADLLDEDIRRMAIETLKHPELQDTEASKRLKRLPPPDGLFLVDDVYISAYMTKQGVPKLIVPAGKDAVFPVASAPQKVGSWGDAPPAPPGDYNNDISTVDALHGQAKFDLANYGAVKYFHHLMWW